MIYCPILNIMSAARVQTFNSLVTQILQLPAPAIVAIDGRSASGKSTFASRLTRALECQCVHTDDIAWNHSFFDWWPLLIHHVLEPFRAGQAVLWTPDAWREHERSGAIIVQPAPILLVEGVSSTRRELSNWIDYTVWMETDVQLAETRGLERDGPDGREGVVLELRRLRRLLRPRRRNHVVVVHEQHGHQHDLRHVDGRAARGGCGGALPPGQRRRDARGRAHGALQQHDEGHRDERE